ncbi:thioredoxin family protein [Chitinophaga pendula]|uniref:thioredoxin family protein n=1 Tax=Chitinophaga TaxID=79328 RepID=UPI000BAE7F5A|nr:MULTISPECIES: thioredoxin family protein [Chitinophaga]ASZ11859.1 hypothetical protein CK934_13275 [Chitinophaga sp. MD30]UCJ05116.1 thioredoxin family protein [Chitinophaga pendula]
MKKITLMLAVLCTVLRVYAQEGIQFTTGSWNHILQQAKAENKLVFIDVYTTWCKPCKMMDEEVFTRKDVGEAFNAAFINVKMDAERGGGRIARLYDVKGYPTYLFVNGDGQLVYKVVGSTNAERFISYAQAALIEKEDPKPLIQWKAEYAAGKRGKTFLVAYFKKKMTQNIRDAQLLEEVFEVLSPEDATDTTLMKMVYTDDRMFQPGGHAFRYTIKHYQAINNTLGDARSLQVLFAGIYASSIKGEETGLRLAQSNLLSIAMTIDDKHGILMAKSLPMIYYRYNGDSVRMWKATHDLIEDFVIPALPALAQQDSANFQAFMAPYLNGTQDSSKVPGWKINCRLKQAEQRITYAYQLRDAAEAVYKNYRKPAAMKKAMEWARLADASFPHFSAKAVYAGLLFSNGEKAAAINMMQQASEDFFLDGHPDKKNILLANAEKLKAAQLPEQLWP